MIFSFLAYLCFLSFLNDTIAIIRGTLFLKKRIVRSSEV